MSQQARWQTEWRSGARMIRRSRRREAHTTVSDVVARADELRRLRRKVADLEAELARAIEDQDAVVHLRSGAPAGSFAAAWTRAERAPDGLDEFFASGAPDLRARRWLLAAN